MHSQFRRLARDIPNDRHDRRCHSGVQAIPTFKAGMPFVVRMKGSEIIGADILTGDRSERGSLLGDQAAVLADYSDPSTPRTADEACLEAFYAPDVIVRYAVRKGLLAPETLAQWASAFVNDEEE